MATRKIVPFHDDGGLTLPLANGSVLRVTAFRDTPRIALAIHGPRGGSSGGVILRAPRARLLASWLARLADESERAAPPAPPLTRAAVRRGRRAPVPARSADRPDRR